MNEGTKTIVLDSFNRQRANLFFSKYYQKCIYKTDYSRKFYLGDKTLKKCRFCGRSIPQTSFKSDAHVIPQLLGNRNFLSNFECDICNSLFSNYENSLSSYLGPLRTIAQIIGKKNTKVPTFKDPKSNLEIRNSEKSGIDTEIINIDENIEADESGYTLNIKGYRHTFRPIDIYKILVKIGLCLIDFDQVNEYQKAIKFIKNVTQKKEVKIESAKMYYYFVPGSPLFDKPIVELWERIETGNQISVLKHSMVLYLPYLVVQIFLPYNSNDVKQQIKGNDLDMPPIPLMIDYNNLNKDAGFYKFEIQDLSSRKRLKNEPFEIQMKSDQKPFKVKNT